MRRIIILGFLIFSVLTGFSQVDHLKFKGLEIKGTTMSFANKLASKGFTITSSKDKTFISMKGQFVGKECDVYIVGSQKSNTAYKVIVYLPEKSTWSSLKSEYLDFKQKFQSKYGEGNSFESFREPYYEGDGYELQALDKDKCSFVTFFKFNEHSISVEATKFKSVSFSYEDSIGVSIMEKEKNSIIEDDI